MSRINCEPTALTEVEDILVVNVTVENAHILRVGEQCSRESRRWHERATVAHRRRLELAEP
jgi:hypothetical protein